MDELPHELRCSFCMCARKRGYLSVLDEKHPYCGAVKYVENNPVGAERVREAVSGTPLIPCEEEPSFQLPPS